MLYVGRRDETKNVGLLIESYRLYRRHDYATNLKLVLAGPGSTSYHDPCTACTIWARSAISSATRCSRKRWRSSSLPTTKVFRAS